MKKKPRLLLVNPWIHDFAAYDFWAKPLGLLYLASVLREQGYELDMIDCLSVSSSAEKGLPKPKRTPFGSGKFHSQILPKPYILKDIPRHYRRYGIRPQTFLDQLSRLERPAAILITSSMTYWYPGVQEAIMLCKKVFQNIPIALGGTYTTLCRNHAISASGADVVFSGPSIKPVLYWLSDLTSIPHRHGTIPLSLGDLPYPAFDLLDSVECVTILTSQGCPYHCTYCASRLLHGGYERRDPRQVAEEIEYWYQTIEVRDFVFYDDALLVDPHSHIIPLLKKISGLRLDCRFHTPNGLHIKYISEEVAQWMFSCGFYTIRLGLEAIQRNLQMESNGKVTDREFEQALSSLHKAGYDWSRIGVYILVGLPNQKKKEVEETIRYVLDNGARPFLAEYSPIPGTALWPRALRCSPYPLANEPLFHNNTILPCQSEDFTYEDLLELKRSLQEMISHLMKRKGSEDQRGAAPE